MSEKIQMSDIEDVLGFVAENPEAKMKFAAEDVKNMVLAAKKAGAEEGVKELGKDVLGVVKDAVTNIHAREKLMYARGYDHGFGIGFMIGVGLCAGVAFSIWMSKSKEENNE